jgi:hypothetical protein
LGIAELYVARDRIVKSKNRFDLYQFFRSFLRKAGTGDGPVRRAADPNALVALEFE